MQPVNLKQLPCPHPIPLEALEALVESLHSGTLVVNRTTVEHVLRAAHAMQVRTLHVKLCSRLAVSLFLRPAESVMQSRLFAVEQSFSCLWNGPNSHVIVVQ